MVALRADTVVLRWLDVGGVDAASWPGLLAALDSHERARAERFLHGHDRAAYVAAHATARLLLSRQVGQPSSLLQFRRGRHGKPEVAGIPHAPCFNLSHTRGLVAVALSLAGDVGVDVERRNPAGHGSGWFSLAFAPPEQAYLRSLSPGQREEAALKLWTLREGYGKATGRGLQEDPAGVWFGLHPPTIHLQDTADGPPGVWRFCLLRPTAAHVLALAVRHHRVRSLTIDAREASASELLGLFVARQF